LDLLISQPDEARTWTKALPATIMTTFGKCHSTKDLTELDHLIAILKKTLDDVPGQSSMWDELIEDLSIMLVLRHLGDGDDLSLEEALELQYMHMEPNLGAMDREAGALEQLSLVIG
jgi:hypothetical protein